METLELRYQRVLKAHKRLAFVVKKFIKESSTQNNHSIEKEENFLLLQDALFKRFEFCYDITWKFLKIYLQEKHGIEVASPRKVFQECLQQKIVTSEEASQLEKMIEARNYASHTYDQNIASQIALLIPSYADLMDKILKKLA